MNITIQHNIHTYLFNFFHKTNPPVRPSVRLSTTYPSIYLPISLFYTEHIQKEHQSSVKNTYLGRYRTKEGKNKSFFRPKTLDLREILGSKDLIATDQQHT